MAEQGYRIERDSMGEVRVPVDALYGAQTQRAVENFPVSGLRFPRAVLRALGMIKRAAAAAIHVSASVGATDHLIPAVMHLRDAIEGRASQVDRVVKTGRTHLMDAVPLRMSQELGGWSSQISDGVSRIESTFPRLRELALGGTAIGTGLNAHPQFGSGVAAKLASMTGLPFVTSHNYFASLSSQDTAVELSGQLKTLAVTLMKIANDLRWMNSGPQAGLAE